MPRARPLAGQLMCVIPPNRGRRINPSEVRGNSIQDLFVQQSRCKWPEIGRYRHGMKRLLFDEKYVRQSGLILLPQGAHFCTCDRTSEGISAMLRLIKAWPKWVSDGDFDI